MASSERQQGESVQMMLRRRKEERVIKIARQQRLEELEKRRKMDDIENNSETYLDQVYDIQPPNIKHFEPTKVRRAPTTYCFFVHFYR